MATRPSRGPAWVWLPSFFRNEALGIRNTGGIRLAASSWIIALGGMLFNVASSSRSRSKIDWATATLACLSPLSLCR